MPIETDENFRMEIREILQSVEDALIDGGFDHYMVATEHGTFHWETTDRARASAAGCPRAGHRATPIISGGSGVAWGLFGILPLAAFCGALVGEHHPSDL